jgi:hypothetical protein
MRFAIEPSSLASIAISSSTLPSISLQVVSLGKRRGEGAHHIDREYRKKSSWSRDSRHGSNSQNGLSQDKSKSTKNFTVVGKKGEMAHANIRGLETKV